MTKFLGIEYSRGACATPKDDGPALAPKEIQKMFPNTEWTFVNVPIDNIERCCADRFGDALEIHKQVLVKTPTAPHIMIGGDHSVNFGHFVALRNQISDKEICLIYIDAHLDIHTPRSSQAEASGAPHGTNVRALLGHGDDRWLKLVSNGPALKSENLFYLGTRSYEPSEIKFATDQNIFIKKPSDLRTPTDWANAVNEIRKRIGNKPYIVSFDVDAIDPKYFPDVWVPASDGLSIDAAEYFVREFAPNAFGFEFVEYAPTGDTQSKQIVKTLIQIAADKMN